MSRLRHADEYERKCSVLSHRRVCVSFSSTPNRCELKLREKQTAVLISLLLSDLPTRGEPLTLFYGAF